MDELKSEIKFDPWRSEIAYVLQDELHNRLTPRVVDIAYSAFMLAKSPNEEDGGPSDWFTDTRPMVIKQIAKIAKAVQADLSKNYVTREELIAAVEAEREACADLVSPDGEEPSVDPSNHGDIQAHESWLTGKYLADAIRARGETNDQ